MKKPLLLSLVVAAASLNAAFGEGLSEADLQLAAGRIDAALVKARGDESWARSYGVPAALPSQADDAMFLRRACIDLAGRLPSADEVRRFVADMIPAKRARLADELLAEPGAAEVRFRAMAEALRIQDEVGGRSQAPFIAWLREAMAQDLPYDQLVATMLRSTAQVQTDPAAGMMQRDGGDRVHTSTEVARAFLGEDLQCARCHDHPYNDFKQRQSYEFAACFASGPADVTVLPPHYLYIDGRSGDKVPPRYLPLQPQDAGDPQSAFLPTPVEGPGLRDQLVQWLTGGQNNRFAEVGALRLWQGLFGQEPQPGRHHESEAAHAAWHDPATPNGCSSGPGWRAPVQQDWFDARNPLSGVMRVLGEEFRRSGCRQREFLRILVRTEAYQRGSIGDQDAALAAFAAAPRLRRLPSEVIWDAWAAGPLAVALPQVPAATHPLRLLGRGSREWADESIPAISHALVRFVMNGPLVEAAAVSQARGLACAEPSRQVEQLFLGTLGRLPDPRENNVALGHLAEHPKTGAQDIAWALLNTSEFMFEP